MSNRIKAATIQLNNYAGEPRKSLEAAEKLICRAAEQGATLAVLPELSTCGYIPNPAVWNFSEPPDGRTVKWVSSLAKRLKIHIGAGFVGCDGKNFFNSYVIMNPKGKIDSIVRQKHPQSYCFEPGNFPVYADTELGRIGIGIGMDAHHLSFYEKMKGCDIDLMIMPQAWPTPFEARKHVQEKDLPQAKENLLGLPKIYASHLNVPVVLVNFVGGIPLMPGITGQLITPKLYSLQGLSQIVEAGAGTATTMESEEGFLVAEVQPEKGTAAEANPPDFKGWLYPGSAYVRKFVIPFDEKKGRKFYLNASERKRTAEKFDYDWED